MKDPFNILYNNRENRAHLLGLLNIYFQDEWLDFKDKPDIWFENPWYEHKKVVDPESSSGRIYIFNTISIIANILKIYYFLQQEYDSPTRFSIQRQLLLDLMNIQDNKFDSALHKLFNILITYDANYHEVIYGFIDNINDLSLYDILLTKSNIPENKSYLSKEEVEMFDGLFGMTLEDWLNYQNYPEPKWFKVIRELKENQAQMPSDTLKMFLIKVFEILQTIPAQSQKGKTTKEMIDFTIKCLVDVFNRFENWTKQRNHITRSYENSKKYDIYGFYKNISDDLLLEHLKEHSMNLSELKHPNEIEEEITEQELMGMRVQFVASAFYFVGIEMNRVKDFACIKDDDTISIPQPNKNHFVRKVHESHNNSVTIWDLISERHMCSENNGFGFTFKSVNIANVLNSFFFHLKCLPNK